MLEWAAVVVDTMRADTVPPVRPAAGLPFAQPGDTPRMDAWLRGRVSLRARVRTGDGDQAGDAGDVAIHRGERRSA